MNILYRHKEQYLFTLLLMVLFAIAIFFSSCKKNYYIIIEEHPRDTIYIIDTVYVYDNDTIYITSDAALLNEMQQKIIGKWKGMVTTPWESPYKIEISFLENGTYSARRFDLGGSAMYYGTDLDSDLKTYHIYDVAANNKGLGEITILFLSGNTVTDDLRQITFFNNFQILRFEMWHLETYGPLLFELERQ